MSGDEQFLDQVMSGISEAEVITIFFPLLRRAIVVDTRHDENSKQMVKVMPQAGSMEERIRGIEKLRPQLGKVRSILGVPWMQSVRRLDEDGIAERLVARLVSSDMLPSSARSAVSEATGQLLRLEQMAFVRMIHGEGYRTVWTAK